MLQPKRKEHLVHLFVHGRVFLLELGIGHVAVAHEVVSLDAGAFRGCAVHAFLPCTLFNEIWIK